jgi:phenylacetate-CoA ligase
MSTESGGLQRQFFDMLMDSQWWSAEKLRDYQRSQLSQLLRHAKKNVPFYEHRLDAVVKPNGNIAWDRWSEIPIVKRKDMVEHREAMLATELPAGHGPIASISTSGSTGLPVTVTIGALAGLANNAARWRAQLWNGLDWSRNMATRLGDDTPPLAPPWGTLKGPWSPPWAGARGSRWVLNVHLPTERVLAFLRDNDCVYLNTGAKTAHLYAHDAKRMGIEVAIDTILTQGSAASAEDRAICRSTFGAKLMEHYSAKEGGQMAHPCEFGTFHINSEICLVEIVDSEGRQVERGETGNVVVTPFFNTAQPLIRYEQGDFAIAGGACGCGRKTATIQSVEGRSLAIFSHPDGRLFNAMLTDAARAALDCTVWQIAQVGPLDFEVRYVPKVWERHGDEVEFRRLFRERYYDDAVVHLKRVAEISLSPAGKFLEYKNEYASTSGTQ